MTKDNSFLGTEPVGKLLFRLAIPTITAQLINLLYNIVDRIYIGHMPGVGDLALTGVGVCMPLILIVSAFSSLVSACGAPRASIFMGQGDDDKAEKTLGTCFTAQLAVALLLTVVLLLWSRPLLLTFGASENTIGYAVQYMEVYALGTAFVQLTLGMNAFITAQGYAKMSMLTVVIGAVSNILLDPLFMFVFGMGVRGAALATILSQGISCVWVICFLCGKKSLLRLKRSTLAIRPKLLLPCLALGISPFIMQSSESLISVCFNSSLLKYGGDVAVGAMAIMGSVMQFAMMPMMGLTQGAQPITSYNFGAKNPDRVKKTFRLLLTCGLCYSTSLWLLVMTVPRVFAGIFTPDPALIDFTAKAMRVYMGALFVFGIQMTCQMTFVALGKAGASVIVAVVRKFILLLPLIFLMPALLEDQTMAVYLAEPIADVLAGLCTVAMFATQFRKALRSISKEQN